jgi:hypothetical protein
MREGAGNKSTQYPRVRMDIPIEMVNDFFQSQQLIVQEALSCCLIVQPENFKTQVSKILLYHETATATPRRKKGVTANFRLG